MKGEVRQVPILTALRLEIEDFLFMEADLLDERRYEEWLQLFSGDMRYRMPIVRNLSSANIAGEYLTGPLDVSWLDEGKETLETRVRQIRTGVHWAEEPPSRTAHLVSNVRVLGVTPSIEEVREVEVSCRLHVYRHRNDADQESLVVRRVDGLRRHGDSWLIFRRTVYMNQPVLVANSLSFFV